MRTLCRISGACFFLAMAAWAQSAFDAVSIRPYRPTGHGRELCSQRMDPRTLSLQGCTLEALVRDAYDLHAKFLVENRADGWVRRESYSVRASTAQPASPEAMMEALKLMLARRFSLQIARQTVPIAGYRLELASGGLKLAAAAVTNPCAPAVCRAGGDSRRLHRRPAPRTQSSAAATVDGQADRGRALARP